VCSAPGVPPMLLELIEHGPSAKDWTLSRLRDDLEACLLPLNRGATRRVLHLAQTPGVTLTGFVPDLAPEYGRAQIAIVPLRAGSGTRIKILEAISYGRPIVSTRAGAEGLDLCHEEHCLLADTPAEFSTACLRLMSDPGLRELLVRNAGQWLTANHSMDQVRSVLHSLFP